MKIIAIQGQTGSFHDIAARQYFAPEEVQTLCCDTFEEVFHQMQTHPDALGLVAIENTIAGSLLQNYNLLRASGATILGEYKLRIEHSLCCLPSDDWADLHEVHSHPVALMQCQGFLKGHRQMKMVEVDDTAGAAANIKKQGLRGVAAICHASAARQLGMKILEEGIEDNKHNFTRFLLLAPSPLASSHLAPSNLNKASLVFSLPHSEGSLSKVLTILSFYDINLTKIQSLPIVGHEWEYLFYVDVTFNDARRYRQSIEAIRPLTQKLTILGEYEAN